MADSSKTPTRTGVILLAHGAPNRVRDIPEYLRNIRGGKSSSPETIREVASRYEQIGGSSPLLEITQSQAAALQTFLNQEGDRFRVYVGMRNWAPYIRNVVRQAVDDGVNQLVALCLAPQFSKWSIGRYLNAFNEALGMVNTNGLDVRFISRWPNSPGLIDAFAERHEAAAAKMRDAGFEDFPTIFTVHSIPEGSVDYDKDPYVTEYDKTLQGLVQRLNLTNWYQSYQSQGMIPVPWLEPTVEDTIDRIAEKGEKAALVFPVGFVCDHIEILYDIDIAFREHADKANVQLFRTESLNTSPLFIEALAGVVWEHLI
jgi:ferrochelatase